MFINHSCEANCKTSEEDGRIWINAIRDIAPGEEIIYDYCYESGPEDSEALCNCGSAKCRGTMPRMKKISVAKLPSNRPTKDVIRIRKKKKPGIILSICQGFPLSATEFPSVQFPVSSLLHVKIQTPVHDTVQD
jgi:hypothetical protein